MAIPERFSNLPDYAFPRLRKLLSGIEPGGEPLILTIGEPRHALPDFVGPVMAESIADFGKYPSNEGTAELLAAISGWLSRRHGLEVAPERIMALNGTREGLFNAALALAPERKNGQKPAILVPNPFYQVYAVAAAAVGAEPVFVPATPETGHLPRFADLPAAVLDRAAVAYLCSPANPQGSIASEDYLEELIALADRHDFLVFADECYSEIWRDAPPPGALAVAARMGLADRVVMFNSLSKRSNLPGLRSGFAAGGAAQIAQLRRLRSYAGAPLPLPVQRVSAMAWADEGHVDASRALYQQKYAIADRVLGNVPGYQPVQGGFFLWLPVPESVGTGEDAAKKLWAEAGIQVLPGAYLARDGEAGNPGRNFIRVALVAPAEQTEAALNRLKMCLYQGG
ncbi:aminotransferase class I/II-fold pyridoxal phosphate-dependent enzyme [Paracoccus sp. P2]|uniref:Aminotransferase class I/II-fold pyridoxal phosphate-dependent enzyme n=1 Tax=Paracoccus pantotrophus TaxID=82367 RepID=A0A1I5BET5_PARPN|nr:aminotransferase class I/II-fold pyridoxal phosphate-dependent enzyme [Paracoccus pantotrophus]MDF3852745.1 aminotransferase class I/II-fold pyridoxal phosphate-dependent enzyme [Paracoccus pantotrophus]QFG36694.1 aminotransferase class I/II-fold pyridoxal phosphate-dependent enzyme [Paracoccus pantotrophus]QLH16356.1 aminotransferase class I/II-fold pyridoxal phosphate-dependent enzyme [Paracoccus pantotrophus]RDD97173.1 aminotransferase class I/II-fold pyridoxal phosphate-dependent enzyme 